MTTQLDETFKHDVDHMPGQRLSLSDIKGTSKYVVKDKEGKVVSTHSTMLDAVKTRSKMGGNRTHSVVKEEVESLDEAHKLNDTVIMSYPSLKGVKGRIGEIRHAAYKGGPKTYTIDYQHPKHSAQHTSSIQLSSSQFKAHKEGILGEEVESVDEANMSYQDWKKKLPNDISHIDSTEEEGKSHAYKMVQTPDGKRKYKIGTYYHNSNYGDMHEEVESLDEISKKTLGSYVKAAAKDAEQAGQDQEHYGDKSDYARGVKRQKGISKAIDRLTKEEVESVDELSMDTIKSYKAKVATNPAPSRTTSDILHKAIRRFAGKERAEDRIHHDEMVKMRARLGIKEETVTEGEFADSLKSRARTLVKKLTAPVKDPILDQMKDLEAARQKRLSAGLEQDYKNKTGQFKNWDSKPKRTSHYDADSYPLKEETLDEGKFIETHKGEDDHGEPKPNPKHPAYATHKKAYDAKVAERKASTFSLKNHSARSKAPEENPVKMHHIDSAISNSFPDVEPYDHLARQFPHLHRASGKFGSKLTDLANKTVAAHTKNKHKTLSSYSDAAYKDMHDDKMMGEEVVSESTTHYSAKNGSNTYHLAVTKDGATITNQHGVALHASSIYGKAGGHEAAENVHNTVVTNLRRGTKSGKDTAENALKKFSHFNWESQNSTNEETLDESDTPDRMKGKQKPYVSSDGKGNYEVLGNIGQTKATFTRATHGNDAHTAAQKHLRSKYSEYIKEEVLDEGSLVMKTHRANSNFAKELTTWHPDRLANLHKNGDERSKRFVSAELERRKGKKLGEEIELDEAAPSHKVGDTVYATSPTNKALTMTGKVTKIGATLTTVKHKDGSEAHYPHKLVDNDYEVLHPNQYKKLQREHLEQTGELLTLSEVKYMVENANGGAGAIAQHGGIDGQAPANTGKAKKMMGNKASVDAIVKIIAKGAKPN